MTDTVRKDVESFRDNEIAVDLRHKDLVIKYLNGFVDDQHRGAEVLDAEPRLDLALIGLDADHIATTVQQEYDGQFTVIPGVQRTPLDYVLDGLKIGIGQDFGGWYPRMGKNRSSDTIGGLPHIDTGRPVSWEYPKPSGKEITIPPIPAGVPEVRVGVIDGQLFPNHELDHRWYTLDSESVLTVSADEDHVYPWLTGHSAFVAGKIFERAPAARLEFRGVLKGDVPSANVWDVAKAMAEFVDGGVKLLNLSIGCYTRDGQAPFVLERAVEVLTSKGVLLVAAAGNHGNPKKYDAFNGVEPNSPIYPAASPGVVAVGAVEPNESYGFHPANFTPEAPPWMNLVAPGSNVTSTYLSGLVRFTRLPGLSEPPQPSVQAFKGYASWSGTSFAAATITGEIARKMSEEGKSPQQALADLLKQEPDGHGGIGRYQRP
jgi:membrane-anchored mycosin MYCP